MEEEEKIKYVMKNTKLVRSPRQKLATFGSSVIDYWVVTEIGEHLSVVRDGKVVAERPRIVTPFYLANVDGFSEQAKRYLRMMAGENPHEQGIFYRYRNEPREMNVVSESMMRVIDKINARLDEEDNRLSTIIRGVEELWDVSLLMFIYELTRGSFDANVDEFRRMGSLNIDSIGVPRDARNYIEELFEHVRKDFSRAPELVAELNRWGLFPEYEDRFLALFKRR